MILLKSVEKKGFILYYYLFKNLVLRFTIVSSLSTRVTTVVLHNNQLIFGAAVSARKESTWCCLYAVQVELFI